MYAAHKHSHLTMVVHFKEKKFMVLLPIESTVLDCKTEIARVYAAISGSIEFESVSELVDSNQCILYDDYQIGMLLHDRSELFAIPGESKQKTQQNKTCPPSSETNTDRNVQDAVLSEQYKEQDDPASLVMDTLKNSKKRKSEINKTTKKRKLVHSTDDDVTGPTAKKRKSIPSSPVTNSLLSSSLDESSKNVSACIDQVSNSLISLGETPKSNPSGPLVISSLLDEITAPAPKKKKSASSDQVTNSPTKTVLAPSDQSVSNSPQSSNSGHSDQVTKSPKNNKLALSNQVTSLQKKTPSVTDSPQSRKSVPSDQVTKSPKKNKLAQVTNSQKKNKSTPDQVAISKTKSALDRLTNSPKSRLADSLISPSQTIKKIKSTLGEAPKKSKPSSSKNYSSQLCGKKTNRKSLSLSKEEASMVANITPTSISTLLDNEDLWDSI